MQGGGSLSLPGTPREPVTLSIASSVTKANWLRAGAADFAAAGITTADGRPIAITVQNVLSGESMLQIADRALQPVVWSPGEATWVDQLAERWNRANGRPVTGAP
jgi:hypothetical protein